jgi:hypothetical protein
LHFHKAVALMKAGYEMRYPDMGAGWCVIFEGDTAGGKFWWVNPITGNRVGFGFTDEEKARTDWAKLRDDGGP